MAALREGVAQPSIRTSAPDLSGASPGYRSRRRGRSPVGIQWGLDTASAHWFELTCSAIFAALALTRVGPLRLPLGIGGLYALMAQSIQQAHFALPVHIPYYGPGGIPFAYPPVALYLLAALSEIPHTSILTWFRYLPVIMCALSLWPVYGLYHQLLPTQFMARIATILFATSPAWLAFDLWADGSVRSFAFFWGMLSLLLGWPALAGGSRRHIVGAAVCFGIALASHLEVAVFVGISLLVLVIVSRPHGLRFFRAALIVAGGTLVAAPWWLTVLIRTGIGPFIDSSHSHGGVTGQLDGHFAGPIHVIAVILAQYVVVDPLSVPIYAIAVLGIARCLRQRAWTVPLWTAALWILMPEGQRFVILGLAAAAAIPLAELPLLAGGPAARSARRRRIALAVLCLSALYSAWHMWQWEFGVAPDLTSATWRAATWLRGNTNRDARFVVVSDILDQPEWFPFIAHRTPVMGHWGAEWTGGYSRQTALIADQLRCAQRESYTCLHTLFHQQHLAPAYLVLVNRHRLRRLQRQIASQPAWHEVYTNSSVAIWHAARP